MRMSMQGDSADSSNGHAPTASFDSPQILGVRVVVDPDPAIAGARLSDELGGDLIFDLETARHPFAGRAPPARGAPVGPRDQELAPLLRQADEIEALDDHGDDRPDLDDATLAELRDL